MGLGNFSHDDGSDDSENNGDSKPGVSYIYIRDPGHSSNGRGFNPEARAQLTGKSKPLPSDSDIDLDNTRSVSEVAKNVLPQYGSQHDWFSQIVGGLFEAVNNDDYNELFDHLFVDAEALAGVLEEDDELRTELIEALASHEGYRQEMVDALKGNDPETSEDTDEETEETEA